MSNIEWGTETDKKLEQIAMAADYVLEQRGGLDTRSNDTEDFPEVSVSGIRRMLREAYELGKAER